MFYNENIFLNEETIYDLFLNELKQIKLIKLSK